MKIMKKMAYYKLVLLFTVFALMAITARAQYPDPAEPNPEINSKLSDLHYDESSASIIFTIELQAGNDYEPLGKLGDFGSSVMRWDIYLESGVTINRDEISFLLLSGGTWLGLSQPTLQKTIVGGSPDGGTYFGATIVRRTLASHANDHDLGNEYLPIVQVTIPVTSANTPTSATKIVQRTFDDFSHLRASAWGNQQNPIISGRPFKPDKSEYPIETCTDPISLSLTQDGASTYCAGSTGAIGTVFTATVIPSSATDPFTYTWYSNNTDATTGGTLVATQSNVSDATSTYQPTNLSTGTYYYYCVVTNDCGTATSTASGAITVTPRAIAGDITLNGATICSGQTATLTPTTSVVNPTFNWYKDAALTALFHTGSSYTTSALTADSTFYVTVQGDAVCENASNNAKIVTITVNPRAIATDITLNGATICSGQTATLTPTTSVVNPTFNWYKDAALTALFHTGNSYITSALTADSTFYVTVQGDGVCENASNNAKIVTITVNPRAIATDITLNGATICSGQTATLTPTTSVVNPTFNWYKDAALTALFHTGNSYITSALTADSTFYVTVQGDAICENASNNAKVVTVTVTPRAIATDITLNGATICSGQTATLTPTTSVVNPIFNWYKDAALTALFHTGSSYTTSVLTADSTFYVTVQGDGVCENASNNAKVVTVTVNPRAIATDITLNGATICSDQTATLTPTTSVVNPTFNWYKDAALTVLFHTGSSYTTSALTADSTFYVTVQGDGVCENASNNAKVVTVTVTPRAIAGDITLNGATICSGQTATLTPTTSVVNPTFNWYKDAALTALFHTGSSYTTSALTADSTFYVTVQGDAVCENASNNAKIVTITVNPRAIATDITLNGATICSGQTATLTPTTSVVNPTFNWYKDAALTALFHTGNSYITSALTADSTFYVTVQGDAICENASNNAKVVTVTVTPRAIATDITLNGATICSGQTATLTPTTSVVNPTFNWYKDAALTALFHTGSSYTTSVLTADSTFYVTVQGDAVCENASNNAKVVTVTVNPRAIATDITLNGATICSDQTATLTPTTSVVNPTFNWYKDAALTVLFHTGSSYTTSALTADSTFYVTVQGDGVCENASNNAKVVTVTVTPRAIAGDITLNGATICSGQTATLTPTTSVVNPTFNWYKDAALTALFHTGSSYTTSALTADSTFYVTVQGDAVCENASNNAKIVTITVNPRAIATDITLNGATICSGQTATLTPTTSVVNPTFNWYKDAALTALFHTGNSYITSALTADSTFYVTVQGDGVCENASNNAKIVTITVNPRAIATDITLNGATICSGQTATLTPTTSVVNPTFNWYKDAALTALFHTGNSYITSALTADSTFYVTVQGDAICENASNNAKVVTVTVTPRAIATDITLNGATICSGQTATLTPTTSVVNPIFNWYKDAALTALFHTGSSYTTSVLTADSTFYVTVQGDAVCENASNNAKVVTVTVNPRAIATDITLNGATICSDQTATLTPTTSVVNPTFNWYKDAALTVLFHTGSSYTTSALTADSTFYVTVQGDGVCENASNNAKTVTITVTPRAIAGDITLNGTTICSDQTATLTPTTSVVNPTFNWYKDAALTVLFHTGSSYTTSVLTADSTFYVTVQGDAVCENAANNAKSVTVTITPTPEAPTGDAAQSFCAGATVADLAAAGTDIKWYGGACKENLLASDTELVDGTTYYGTQTVDGCESAGCLAVTVTLTPTPEAPTGDAAQSFCAGATVADLTAAGTDIKWYGGACKENLLTSDTELIDGTTYYATQTVDGCESAGCLTVTVTLTPTPEAPTGDAAQSFCAGATVADLTAAGTDIKWYGGACKENLLTSDTELIDGTTYYATQTVDGCESAGCLTVTVTITPTPEAPTGDAAQSFCAGATVADLAAAGTDIKWYGGACKENLLASDTELVDGTTYYGTQTVDGCESAGCLAVTVTITPTPEAPTGDAAQSFCAGATVADLTAAGTDIKWYGGACKENLLTSDTELIDGTTYYATQTVDGCESAGCLTVTVTLTPTPEAPTGDAAQSFCAGATVADLAAAGTDIKWYGGACKENLLTSGTELVDGTTYYATQTVDGCESTGCLAVTVVVNSAAIAGTINVNAQPTCGNNNGSIKIVATGATSYEYSIDGGVTYKALAADGIIKDLYAGHYVVTVRATDSDCSDISQTLALVNSDAATIVATIETEDATNCTSNDGSVIFTIAGTLNYQWKIDDGTYTSRTTASVTVDNLAVGDHTITIKDANGCENPGGAFTIRATESGITFSLAAQTQGTCQGANGSLRITVTAGTAADYRLNKGKWVTMSRTTVDVSVPAGTHTIELRDATGCITLPQSVTITNNGSDLVASVTATTATSCGEFNGTITLAISGGTDPYTYSFDGDLTNRPLIGSTPFTISGLSAGIYEITVNSVANCPTNLYNVEVGQGLGSNIAPPRVTTPQTFCTGATVANLQAEGVDIIWYNESGNELLPTEVLTDEGIYYAVQRVDGCESTTRSAVKVIIDDHVVLTAPNLPGIFDLCDGATLGDIPTYGNTNIVWYNAIGAEITDLTTPLNDGDSYFAAQRGGGDCESPLRTEVIISLGASEIEAPEMESPQYFCEGALVANLAVPNNQIVWYRSETGGTPLPLTTHLVDGDYYAAQKAGDCESAIRVKVEVIIDQYSEPLTRDTMAICGMTNPTLGDLWISGAGVIWYDEENIIAPLSTPIANGDKFWAVQSNGTCEGNRFEVYITTDCYTVGGTVFPFVYTNNSLFDDHFTTYVKLYTVPTAKKDRIGAVRKQTPLYTTKVTYYDGTVFIANTPKYPGTMGFFDNPGLPILWDKIGQTPGTPNPDVLSRGELPNKNIGMYVIENVPQGKYVIEVSREGYLVRYGVITVVPVAQTNPTDPQPLGHRELLAGDVNGDLQITEKDFSAMGPRFVPQGDRMFMWKYDLNANGDIESGDSNLIRINIGAFGNAIYEEAYDFMNP